MNIFGRLHHALRRRSSDVTRTFRTPRADVAFEALEDRRLLAADLQLAAGSVQSGFDAKKGYDVLRVPVLIQNIGDAAYGKGGTVDFYFSTDQTFDSADISFASVKLPRVSAHGSATVTLDIPEPKLIDPPAPQRAVAAGNYFVFAKISDSIDSNSSNNTALASGQAGIDYNFGHVANGKPLKLTVTLHDKSTMTLSLEGDGTGQVDNINGNVYVSISGTTFNSNVVITTSTKILPTIAGLSVTGAIKSVRADHLIVNGTVLVQGGIQSLRLAGLHNGALQITATAAGAEHTSSVDLGLGDVQNVVVSSDYPMSALAVSRWLDTDSSPDTLLTPFITSFTSAGDFQPSITVTSVSNKGYSIESAIIKGSISGAWLVRAGMRLFQAGSTLAAYRGNIGGPIGTFKIDHNLQGTLAVGSILSLSVGGNLQNATILVGAFLGADSLLGGAGSGQTDTFAAGSIGSLTVRGSVSNSIIAAGLSTTNSTLLDSDDHFAFGTSSIGKITIFKTLQTSFFISPSLPAKVSANNKNITTAGNPAFITTLPRST